MPLRRVGWSRLLCPFGGCACHHRPEGHVYRARRIGMDYQTLCRGPDEQVPPGAEGHACRAR